MKRLGAIIAIALVLTIGGVYATFDYAQGNVGPKENQEMQMSLAGMSTSTSKGEIKITDSFKLTIDDIKKELTTGGKTEGTTVVSFTPAKLADADVRANGISLKLTITVTGNEYVDGENNTHQFVSIKQEALDGVILNGGAKIKEDGYTINFAEYITVNEISLPTTADYQAYNNAFADLEIKYTISEA